MLRSHVPHAILLVGPASVGKTTLALDLAAGLLCTAGEPSARPCRECRACRLVTDGNHPDLHRLAPEGAGRQIGIGEARHPEPGTVRHLIGELALLPVEGGARVAIVEEAERMNEDAQNALLKTLEEPPAGTTIVLCATDEDRLLPTVRSRCARLRLGTVGPREIESALADRGLADAPTAARLARLAGGRPGLALAYANAPEAVVARGEIARTLVDLLSSGRATRLPMIRALAARAAEMTAALAAATAAGTAHGADVTGRRGRRPGRGRTARTAGSSVGDQAPAGASPSDDAEGEAAGAGTGGDGEEAQARPGESGGRAPAAERRRAALALLDIWRDVARDVLVVARGGRSQVRDAGLLEEIESAARSVDVPACARFLERLELTARLVEANASPELALDVLVLAWTGSARAA